MSRAVSRLFRSCFASVTQGVSCVSRLSRAVSRLSRHTRSRSVRRRYAYRPSSIRPQSLSIGPNTLKFGMYFLLFICNVFAYSPKDSRGGLGGSLGSSTVANRRTVCFAAVSRVFRRCFAAVSRCLAGVSRVCLACFACVSRLSRGCFAAVSRCLTADSHCESVQRTGYM